jgi:putative hydrolase of the HAD superfamily
LIDAVVFSVDAGMLKPDPRIYRFACDRLRVAPERCLYVGDGSSTELTGACRVGMSAVLICVPYEQEQIMQREEVQRWQGPVIRHLAEVPNFLSPER